MESTRLTEFYRALTVWPKTKTEIGIAAEAICELMQVPFAAVYLTEDMEQVAFRERGGVVSDTASPEMIEEMLKTQLKRLDDRGALSETKPKQLQISRDSAPLAAVLTVSNLTISPVLKPVSAYEGKSAGQMHVLSASKRAIPGWIIVGSVKPLSDRELVLLQACNHRLSELCAVARLENALQLRSQFFSIASHELKTPLTSIYGILQLQQRMAKTKNGNSPVSDERKESFFKIVIRQVERLNELIDGLLDVSRIQNNRFVIEPAQVDIAMILRDTISARLTLIAKEAGVTIKTDLVESLQAFVDPVRLEEVITNLVMNAIRFSPEGGVVSVKLRGEGGSFRLTVRDQGPSVPFEDRERIFQPFERAQRTSRLGGLGLGLYISRQIAQLHGGNVSLVESIPGKGNVFEAYFPASAVSTGTPSAASA